MPSANANPKNEYLRTVFTFALFRLAAGTHDYMGPSLAVDPKRFRQPFSMNWVVARPSGAVQGGAAEASD